MKYAPPPTLPVVARYSHSKRPLYSKQDRHKHSEQYSSPKRRKLDESRMRTKSVEFKKNGWKKDGRISARERKVTVAVQSMDNHHLKSGHSNESQSNHKRHWKDKRQEKDTDIPILIPMLKKKKKNGWQEKLATARVVEVCEEVEERVESRKKKAKKKKKVKREIEKQQSLKVSDFTCSVSRSISRDRFSDL
jgi:hypothetical protein